jgi:hypothetical protein
MRFSTSVSRWHAALLFAGGAAALTPVPATWVERVYSSRLYPRLQQPITAASNLIPIALFDLLTIGVVVVWTGFAVHDLQGSGARRAKAVRVAWRTAAWGASLYLLFLLVWGLNYRRVRLVDKLPFDAAAVTADVARRNALVSVAQLNALHDRAHTDGWTAAGTIDPALAGSFAQVLEGTGMTRPVVPGRPKRTLLFDWYFRRAGVDGMTDPYFLETLVASRLLPFERPFVVAHEWAHLAGVADEGEANFIAWLACVDGTSPNQYSGWLFVYGELARAIGRADGAALAQALAPGPRADLRAIRDRAARDINQRVSNAGWQVYDSYLKANRVESGSASYGEVLRLILGVRLRANPLAPQ